MTEEKCHELARLKRMFQDRDYRGKWAIIHRRMYAIENEMDYSNPFDDHEEVLYRLSTDMKPVTF